MKSQATYPKVRAVEPLPNKKLLVRFETGDVRVYDCQPLLNEEAFRPLADDTFFRQVHPDPHGYAVIWSDELDLAESELWINGKPAEQSGCTEPGDSASVPSRTSVPPGR
jgi:hypothetical protein